jgi:hypothetical protein
MIAIPVSGEVVRRTLRTAAVVSIAVAAVGFSLQDLFITNLQATGAPDFYTRGNIVLHPGPRARDAGIAVGDRIDYSLMPTNERYGDSEDGLRWPPVGRPVSYVVERNGRRRVVTFKALAWYWGGWFSTRAILVEIVYHAPFLVLVLLASALFLIRPTPLTTAFFLFAAASGGTPFIYSFLSPGAYAALLVLGDTLSGLGVIGIFVLALYLKPRQLPSRLIVGAAVLLLAIIVVPIASSDVFELIHGIRPAWPIAGWASFLAKWFCVIAAFVILARATASATAPRMLRLLAALLAGIAALTMLSWILNWTVSAHLGSWYVANFPVLALSRPPVWGESPVWWVGVTLKIFSVLGLLLAFYVIVRARVADTGPVLSRVVAYIIVVLLLVAALVVANIGFAPLLPKFALLVPFEIFAAIAIGFWVSGLRDLAGSLSLAGVDAWSAWAKGHPRDERDALAQSLGFAERTRRPGIIAEVRAQMAFSAWRDGDDAEFERSGAALQRALVGNNLRGLRGFARAATSDDEDLHFEQGDLHEWRSRAALVLCARTNDAGRAQKLARDALAGADRAGLASLQVLASVAVAETCSEQRDDSLERAHAIARDAGWPALSKSILALRANARDVGILQTFVDVRLRKSRPARPMFEVSFFNGELCQDGARVALPEKELELLFAAASTRAGINSNDLIDAVWPEAEGDAARNAFYVCLHRLRKNAGDARIVAKVGKGYVVHPFADVDLWRFQELIAACRESDGRKGAGELREMCDALRAGDGRRATLGEWFYRFQQMLDRKLDEAERLLGREAARTART